MLVLDTTTDAIEVKLGAAHTTNALKCVASWRDITTTAYTPGRTLIDTNGTTSVDAVGGPGASTQRVVDFLSVYNNDTITHTVTVTFDANGTEYPLFSASVPVGYTLRYTDADGFAVSAGNTSVGYVINVQALTSSPTDAQTVYFGTLPKAPVTAAGTSKVYIPRTGILKHAEIYVYSGTAGTAENWSLYVRHNNTTDYLIATVGSATNERRFTNNALTIAVTAGDYIEIKGVQPTWATNPLTTIYGGYVYIE